MRRLRTLAVLLAAAIASTAVHYTHNFVAVSQYPGPSWLYTPTRVAIVLVWPLFTWLGLIGYRRYRQGRLGEAHIALAAFSFAGISTLGHYAFGAPRLAPLFNAALLTDPITGFAVLGFVVWSAQVTREPA